MVTRAPLRLQVRFDLPGFIVRLYQPGDAAPLGELMYLSVRDGAARHYTAAQRHAWISEPRVGDQWQLRLEAATTFVAEDGDGLAGFMTLATDGYIDLAFVRPDCLGRGVAVGLYQRLETRALELGLARLYCEASDLAKPFFLRQGWQLIATQQVAANGVMLRNHKMEKRLVPV